MTTAPRYVSLDSFRDYLSSSDNLGTFQDGLLTDTLCRVEDAIDVYTRRNFAATAGTRYLNQYTTAIAGRALYLQEDLYQLDYLQTANSQVIPVGAAGSVFVEPRIGPPYRILRLKVAYVWSWNVDQDVIVAGTWGYSLTAPEAIRDATVRWAAYRWRMKDVGVGDVAGFAEGGEVLYPKGMPDDVKGLLSVYRSRSGGVV
jgi:hypothetical protein